MTRKTIFLCAGVLCLLSTAAIFAGGRKEEKNMISLNMLTREAGDAENPVVEAAFQTNQSLSYAFELYESVGFDADYQIADESVIAFVERKEKYLNPKRMRQGMTGSDDAEGVFVFKTLKKGRTTLVVRHLFRGETEKVVTFHMTVE